MPEYDSEMDFGPDILTLMDEDGCEHQFEVIDDLDVDDEQYLAMIPYFGEQEEEMLEDDGELVILKSVEDEDGTEYLEPIDNEEEFNKISAMFMKRLEEYYDFKEEE